MIILMNQKKYDSKESPLILRYYFTFFPQRNEKEHISHKTLLSTKCRTGSLPTRKVLLTFSTHKNWTNPTMEASNDVTLYQVFIQICECCKGLLSGNIKSYCHVIISRNEDSWLKRKGTGRRVEYAENFERQTYSA
jgi:hypothetical protein